MRTLLNSTIVLLLISTIFYGCGQSHSSNSQPVEFEIPSLLSRDNAIGSNEEAEMITAQYNNAVTGLTKDPLNNSSKLKLAEVFVAEGRISGNQGYYTNAALATLNSVLDGKPKQDDKFLALTMKGMVQLTLHKFSTALTTGKEALEINAQNAGIYGVLVDANLELGNYTQAVSMADKMVSLRPDLRSYSRISYLREIHGETEGAIEAMDMAVKAGFPGQDQTEWCRVQLGKLYEHTGRLDHAEMHYRIALKERDNYPWALAALGVLENKKGNSDEAIRLITLANTYMENAGFYEALAKVYRNNNEEKYEEAVANAERLLIGAAEVHHKNEHAHDHGHGHSHEVGLEMAKLHLQFTGNLDEALKNAKHELKTRPNNVEVNQVLATIYHLQKNTEKAEFHMKKAAATSLKSAEIFCLKGLIAQSDDAVNEIDMINKSFEIDPFQDHILVAEAKKVLAKSKM